MAFADNIRHYVAIIESLHKPVYLMNTILMDEFVSKLTESYQRRWAQHIAGKAMDELSLKDFSSWLSYEAELVESVNQLVGSKRKQEDGKKTEKKTKGFVLATSATKETDSNTTTGQKVRTCVFCADKSHSIEEFKKFSVLNVN